MQYQPQGSGLPYNPPFVAPVQVPQHMQQFLPALTGFAMLEVQQSAGKNQWRQYYANVVSQNNWQNDAFMQLVSGIAEYAEFLMSNQRMQPEQALQQAASEMTSIMTAMVAQQNQAQLAQYSTPGMLQNAQELFARFQQIRDAVLQHQQRQQFGGGMPGQGMWGAPGNVGYHNPAVPAWAQNNGTAPMGGYNMNRGPMNPAYGNPGYGNPVYGNPGYRNPNMHPSQMAHRQGGRDVWQAGPGPFQPNQHHDNGMPATGMRRRNRQSEETSNRNTQNEELSMGADGRKEHRTWTTGDNVNHSPFQGFPETGAVAPASPFQNGPFNHSNRSRRAEEAQAEAAPTHVSLSSDQEWPKVADPTRPWDSVLLEDGTELRPAFKSGWKATLDSEHPYHLVYDTTKFMLFHVHRPDGRVYETLRERTPEMDYLQNELDPKARAAEREIREGQSKQVVTPNWGLAEKLRPHTVKPMAVQADESVPESQDLASEREPRALTEVIQAHSLQEAEVKLALYAKDDPLLRDLKAPMEFYYDEITPILTNNAGTVQVVRDLCTAPSYADLLQQLGDVRYQVDDQTWEQLDKRMTAAVNEVLAKNLSLEGWKIDSFVEDYTDLCEALESSFGKDLVDTFNGYGTEVINSAISVLSDEDFKTYLAKMSTSQDDTVDNTRWLAFRERISVTQVPWKKSELDLDLSHGGVIPETQMPQLYAAVDAIFERTLDHPVTFARRYLQTADKKLIELRHGYLGKNSLMMFEV